MNQTSFFWLCRKKRDIFNVFFFPSLFFVLLQHFKALKFLEQLDSVRHKRQMSVLCSLYRGNLCAASPLDNNETEHWNHCGHAASVSAFFVFPFNSLHFAPDTKSSKTNRLHASVQLLSPQICCGFFYFTLFLHLLFSWKQLQEKQCTPLGLKTFGKKVKGPNWVWTAVKMLQADLGWVTQTMCIVFYL